MPDDYTWDDLLASRAEAASTAEAPATRRDARDALDRRRRRRRRWPWVLLSIVLVLCIGGGIAWSLVGERAMQTLGLSGPADYQGAGNGEEVTVVIADGQIGEDVARTLVDEGVTASFDAFYDLLLVENPTFTPGAYALEMEMSAASALAALSDPENRVTARVTIPEGVTAASIYERLSEATGVPLEEYEAAAADHASFGVPAEAPSLEGYLFPATYDFDPGVAARDQLQRLVDAMIERLNALGVAETDRHRVLTAASLVQREARQEDDFYRVSRVIQNRIAAGMPLQFDSTSHYGYAWAHGSSSAGETVFTTDEERADDNPYNTYVHTGLPLGPISAPGDLAIDAALHPVDGTWLFFVTVNLETGETVFSNTGQEHEAAAAQLREWCRTSDFDC